VVQIHPPQPNLPFWFQWVEPISKTGIGDSKPKLPAQISGFLYAQFYTTAAKGTRFGFRLRRVTSLEAPNRCRSGAEWSFSAFMQQECFAAIWSGQAASEASVPDRFAHNLDLPFQP
jgi:hypothetical protein